MKGVVLTGHGGLDKLVWRDDLPVPRPASGEVLIRVGASAVNNTDVNTRTGWYAKSVRGDTASGAAEGYAGSDELEGGWAGALSFPRVQGADCCGRIVAVGEGVDAARIGERVLARPMHHPAGSAEPLGDCDIRFGARRRVRRLYDSGLSRRGGGAIGSHGCRAGDVFPVRSQPPRA